MEGTVGRTTRRAAGTGAENVPLARRTYELIREDILSQRLLPRETLIEVELSERYGVSKTPVREALLALAQTGLVESLAFRGWRVKHFTADDAREIYEIREVLEPYALRAAVPHMTDERLARLHQILSDARRAIEDGDLPTLSRLNRLYHIELVEPCGNSRIVGFLHRLQDQLRVMAVRTWSRAASYRREADQHEAILAAVEAGDGERAARLLRSHIVEFRRRYVEVSGVER
ncbi:MAG TPA: GntR family transcriptional regulator [Candidatus Dormibacteraeota bacterium]|nr:GntR family transcriptional regulator [Candidatus Dormibacteraeota bacterium]